ncbi:MAG TPA: signal peptidase II [Roseiflexaceae bacterium]|nr:signal peptidase II [Roseiflexaceae bacterium]
MQQELPSRWSRPALVGVAVIGLDQLSKAWILRTLGPDEGTSIPLLGSWLSLTYIKNNGVAFGMFQGIPHFFTLTSIVISIGALLFYRYQLPNNRPWIQVSLGMIVGGAIGNIIDRLRYGYVVDFVHVSWFPGIFNLADSAITVGVLMLAGYLLLMGESGASVARKRPADEALLGELLSRDQWRGDRQ